MINKNGAAQTVMIGIERPHGDGEATQLNSTQLNSRLSKHHHACLLLILCFSNTRQPMLFRSSAFYTLLLVRRLNTAFPPNFYTQPFPRLLHPLFLSSNPPTPPHRLKIPYRAMPIAPPNRIATGGVILNHAPPTNAVPVIATNQGSVPNGLPPWTAAVRQPICQSLYTAVKTRPTAAALTPLSVARNHALSLRIRQRPMKPTTTKRPGAYIAMNAIRAPRYDGTGVPATARLPR